MNKKIAVLFGVATLGISTVGMAATMNEGKVASNNGNTVNNYIVVPQQQDYQTGFYISGGAGYGKTNLSGNLLKNKGFTWIASAGYRFNKYVAVESGYMSFAKIEAKNLNSKLQGVYLAGKVIMPVSQLFDVYAKAGAIANTSIFHTPVGKINAFTFAPIVGVGTDIYISQNLAVTLQGIATINTSHNAFPTTYNALAGLTYTF